MKQGKNMASSRNKTICISTEEGEKYLSLCAFEKKDMTRQEACDKYFNADFFTAVKYLPDGFADLVIADPPYNLRKNYGGEVFTEKTHAQYAEFTRSWLREIKRVVKDTGSVYVCCDWRSSLIIGNVLSEFFIVRNRITWQREKGRGAEKNWKNGMEDIWFCTVGEDYTFNLDAVKLKKKVLAPYTSDGVPKDWQDCEDGKFRMTCPSNFWDDITVPFWSMKENTAHPTQKSEKLMAKIILASSNEGDMILEPFGGSGSACVTAKKLGRHYFGTEKNPTYCTWAQLRLERADTDKSIQGFDGKTFSQRNSK